MRHKKVPKRIILPDIKFNRLDVAKLINYVMTCGKKSTAQRLVYQAFEIIAQQTKQDPIEVFDEAIKNLEPSVELRSRRIGGGNYQIPITVTAERRFTLACRWLLESTRAQKGKPMAQKLAQEIINAYKKEGAATKKKMDVYRMAEANRAFSHLIR
ncbi:MAG: 30S ribosomal protein S7 [Candidatus Buchananbacteria bacterium]